MIGGVLFKKTKNTLKMLKKIIPDGCPGGRTRFSLFLKHQVIPLCHPLLIGEVKVEFSLDAENSTILITTTAKSTGKTGVEMEALTATAVAALTIYDMCKAVDRGMKIENIRLVKKSGGKSGTIKLE